MRNTIFLRLSFACRFGSWAGIVDNVRMALAQNNFSAAEAELTSYRAQRGVDAEYIEAYSWLGRAALEERQYDQAQAYAKQTKALALEQLAKRPLDAEPHLPLALGAALEVQAQALAARGQKTQAVALLQSSIRTYGGSSIQDRLQKNLNLLSFVGKPAPALRSDKFEESQLVAGPSERNGGVALLLGSLVWGLQSGSSDHRAIALRVRREGPECHWANTPLRLYRAARARLAER